MPRKTVPSFVQDPNKAAELAALIRDVVSELENDLEGNRTGLTRRQVAQEEQTIIRYLGWAAELAPEVVEQAEPFRPPLQILPASGD